MCLEHWFRDIGRLKNLQLRKFWYGLNIACSSLFSHSFYCKCVRSLY